ncbi:MAG: hypothetical protein JXA69_01010 [Phycisphaerae bacterium]|nr:hypothetical protein [Phycisphaerae bacterium]
MKLTSDEAAYGHADTAEAWHILLRFPLPGATSGDAEYTVYLSVPDSTAQEIVAYTIGRTATAHGFFYQTHGEQRGREDFVEGCVWLKRKSARQWLVTVKAKGRLATRIEGTALLTRRDLDVRDYLEARHAGDIAQLMQNVPAPTPTE